MYKVLLIKLIIGIVRILIVIEWFLISVLFYNSETNSFDVHYFQTEPYLSFVVLIILGVITALTHLGLAKLAKYNARINRELANR